MHSPHAEAMIHHYERRLAAVVAGLSRLAVEVERRPIRRNLRDLKPDYSEHAKGVLHEILWGLANLHLDDLAGSAVDADRALRLPEEEG